MFEKPPGSRLTLSNYIKNHETPLELEVIRKLAISLLRTVKQLHSSGIVHMDLNPDNILVIESSGLYDIKNSCSSGNSFEFGDVLLQNSRDGK